MNFLAHLYLADRTETSLAGSVLGDVVRGPDLSAYPPDIALGIRLHRRVDAFTDRHPIMQCARAPFVQGHRRYAGIVLDMAADHALARQWEDFHPQPLEAFALRCGQAIEAAADWFEMAGGARLKTNAFASLLQSYATDSGMERAFSRTAARMRRSDGLIDAARDWPSVSSALEGQLPELLKALEQEMHELMRSYPAPS